MTSEADQANQTPLADIVTISGPKDIFGSASAADITKKTTWLAGAIDANMVSETILMAAGMAYLNSGARNLEAAQASGTALRKEYTKAIKRHQSTKFMALAAESLLMAYYGYGAIEHYSGLTGTTQAVAVNSAISGGISVTRAGVQYGLMKRGEEAFQTGDKTRGMVFTSIGIGLAMVNALFVAVGFANKYVTQEQGSASHELEKIAADERAVVAHKANDTTRLTAEITEMDKQIAHLKTGSNGAALTQIEADIKKYTDDLNSLLNDPRYDDNRLTDWDRTAKVNMDRDNNFIASLTHQKEQMLQQPASLTADEKKLLDTAMQRRDEIANEIKALDERYQPQLEALKLSRHLWLSKLGGASSSGGDSFSALAHNPTILIEALANVAAISVSNWWAATEGHKQEIAQAALSGIAKDDPWAANKPAAAANGNSKVFMGYDCAADNLTHLRNEKQLDALSKTLNNPESMRAELQAEITRQYTGMVTYLNGRKDGITEDEYLTRLNNVNGSYQKAMDILKDDTILVEISKVTSMDTKAIAQARDAAVKSEDKTPVISSPNDASFKKLSVGAQFKTPDGVLRVKK
ncbi:MAG: hypothetical protein PW788_14280 [Micavibrio sp.]|nr:hypothetical protein [Micavibrio sp.]